MIRALVLRLRRVSLRWSITSTEQYMAAAARDGILDSHTLRAWRDHLAADRVRLALIEARLRRHPRQPDTHAGALVRSARKRQLDGLCAGIWRGAIAGLALWGAFALIVLALGAST